MSRWSTVSRLCRVAAGVAAALILAAAPACGGGGEGTAAGDAAPAEVVGVDYEVTAERYERWLAAQQALDAIPGLAEPPRIDPFRFDSAGLQRAVGFLEGDPRARAALARAGISARDYVLTTVALDQALVAAATDDPGLSPTGPGAGIPPGASPGRTPQPAATPAPAARAAATPARGSSPTATGGEVRPAASRPAVPQARPRITGAPARNVELVRRNRGELVKVLRTMRFRISEPTDEVTSDTSVTRSDSVTVGKDVTVKWDITVRRGKDTTGSRARAGQPDSTRRDSAGPEPPGAQP